MPNAIINEENDPVSPFSVAIYFHTFFFGFALLDITQHLAPTVFTKSVRYICMYLIRTPFS